MNIVEHEFVKIKKSRISDSIINQINQMILDGVLQPGDKLPSERELVEKLGVSRASVREAMSSLESMGIIDIRSGEGTFLNDESTILLDHYKTKSLLKRYEVEELVEARIILETQILQLAIDRIEPESLAEIEKNYANMLAVKDQMDKFIIADFKFHMSIAQASKNSYLHEMLNTTRELLFEVNKLVVLKPGQIKRVLDSHYNIIESIKRKDKNTAIAEMKSHISSIKETL